jgi:hypothetical protein
MARTLERATKFEQLRQHATGKSDSAGKEGNRHRHGPATLEDGEAIVRLRAVSTLRDRLSADVRNRLAARVEADAAGSVPEMDAAVRAAITAALNRIDRMRSLYEGHRDAVFRV